MNSHFNYIDRRTSDKQDIVSSHTLSDYPQEQKKKVLLLKHFKNYLEGNNKHTAHTEGSVETKKDPPKESAGNNRTPLVYVKKWMRTRHAMMFRLSNKIVQVIFQDHTEVILSSETREVTYVNKRGERMTCPLANALESTNAEMAKRLKYAKDILTHMLTANQHHESINRDK